jgi:predicted transcriptional regulator
MATKQIYDVALISIHPEFSNLIVAGEKKVEFRKVRFAREVSHLVIYSTLPIGSIVAHCEVKAIEVSHPSNLWAKYRKDSGIDKTRFFEYYSGCDLGVAIELDHVVPLEPPIPLDSLSFVVKPPQSYFYLDKKKFAEVQNLGSTCPEKFLADGIG